GEEAGEESGEEAGEESGEEAGEEAGVEPGVEPGEEAGEEPGEEARSLARAAYARGQELFEAGQFEEAEAAFEEAYGHVPNPVVLLGLAEARARQGDMVAAAQALDRYLLERPEAPDRVQVEERIAELKGTPATLVLRVEPSDAVVRIDGADPVREVPVQVELAPGDHEVRVRREGYLTYEEIVTLEPGAREKLEVALEPEPPPPEEELFGAGDGIGEATDGETTAADEEQDGVHMGVWVATGVAAASLVAGTVLGFRAMHEQTEFDDDPTAATADRGERLALFADVAFGLSLGAALTALVLYLTDGAEDGDDGDDDASARLRVTPAVGASSGGVNARVRF
ncbi:MAG: PEGA domain-containing protein, partial [Myxococcota bacterium]